MRPYRSFLTLATLAALPAFAADASQAEGRLISRAHQIHRSLIVLDTHLDIPLNFGTQAVDPFKNNEQVSLSGMIDGGLNAAFFIVYTGQSKRVPENALKAMNEAMIKFDAIHRMAEDLYPDRIALAYSANDVVRIHRSGKLVGMIGVENGYSIGRSLETLRNFYRLGARYMSLTHNGHNDIGDSAALRLDFGDKPEEHGGVSEFGKTVIAEMNRLGMMVDVSHASKATTLQAMALSRAPVIASHSGAYGVTKHPRNLDDETLLALKKNGGVIQIIAFDSYTREQPPEQQAAVRALRAKWGVESPSFIPLLPPDKRAAFDQGMKDIQATWPPATVRDLVDHIDHAVKVIDIDHVGISSDFGGGGGVVGWNDVKETENVTLELVRRGYTKAQIEKLWGGNLLRVWRDVERVGEQMRANSVRH